MRAWRIAAVLLACLLLPALARAEELTPEKIADIKKLFVVSKADAAMQEVIDASVAQGRIFAERQGVKLTPETQKIMDKVMRDLYTEKILGPGGAMDQLIPAYAKTFTHEEIRQYLAFYETPLGRKIADTTPQLTKSESDIFTGVALGIMAEFPTRLVAAFKEHGLLPKQSQTPDQAPAQTPGQPPAPDAR